MLVGLSLESMAVQVEQLNTHTDVCRGRGGGGFSRTLSSPLNDKQPWGGYIPEDAHAVIHEVMSDKVKGQAGTYMDINMVP